jgi:type I restriction enzyme M protein
VGAAEQQEEDEPFETKAGRLFARLEEQRPEAAKLDAALTANLKGFGYGD